MRIKHTNVHTLRKVMWALVDKLKVMPWGIAIDGEVDPDHEVTDDEWVDVFRTAYPEDFIKQGGGVCWDYVAYEASYLYQYFPGARYTAWYIEFKNPNGQEVPSHTYLTVEWGGKTWYVEASWKEFASLYCSADWHYILDFVKQKMIDAEEDDISKWSCFVCTYDPLDDSLFGLNAEEFSDRLREIGSVVQSE